MSKFKPPQNNRLSHYNTTPQEDRYRTDKHCGIYRTWYRIISSRGNCTFKINHYAQVEANFHHINFCRDRRYPPLEGGQKPIVVPYLLLTRDMPDHEEVLAKCRITKKRLEHFCEWGNRSLFLTDAPRNYKEVSDEPYFVPVGVLPAMRLIAQIIDDHESPRILAPMNAKVILSQPRIVVCDTRKSEATTQAISALARYRASRKYEDGHQVGIICPHPSRPVDVLHPDENSEDLSPISLNGPEKAVIFCLILQQIHERSYIIRRTTNPFMAPIIVHDRKGQRLPNPKPHSKVFVPGKISK